MCRISSVKTATKYTLSFAYLFWQPVSSEILLEKKILQFVLHENTLSITNSLVYLVKMPNICNLQTWKSKKTVWPAERIGVAFYIWDPLAFCAHYFILFTAGK